MYVHAYVHVNAVSAARMRTPGVQNIGILCDKLHPDSCIDEIAHYYWLQKQDAICREVRHNPLYPVILYTPGYGLQVQ